MMKHTNYTFQNTIFLPYILIYIQYNIFILYYINIEIYIYMFNVMYIYICAYNIYIACIIYDET